MFIEQFPKLVTSVAVLPQTRTQFPRAVFSIVSSSSVSSIQTIFYSTTVPNPEKKVTVFIYVNIDEIRDEGLL